MPRLPLLMTLPLLVAPAWAASMLSNAADGTSSADGGRSNLPVLRKQLRQSSAELEQLQRHVSSEELRSRQASQRLRQQDRALDQLRRQLQALDGHSSAEEVAH